MKSISKSNLKQESALYSETQEDLATNCTEVHTFIHFIVAEYRRIMCMCLYLNRKEI